MYRFVVVRFWGPPAVCFFEDGIGRRGVSGDVEQFLQPGNFDLIAIRTEWYKLGLACWSGAILVLDVWAAAAVATPR